MNDGCFDVSDPVAFYTRAQAQKKGMCFFCGFVWLIKQTNKNKYRTLFLSLSLTLWYPSGRGWGQTSGGARSRGWLYMTTTTTTYKLEIHKKQHKSTRRYATLRVSKQQTNERAKQTYATQRTQIIHNVCVCV